MIDDIENFGWYRFSNLLSVSDDFHKCLLNVTSYGINRVRVLCIVLNVIKHSLLQFRFDSLFNLIVFGLELQYRPTSHEPICFWLYQPFMCHVKYLHLSIIPSYRPIAGIVLQIIIVRLIPNIKHELDLHLHWFLAA